MCVLVCASICVLHIHVVICRQGLSMCSSLYTCFLVFSTFDFSGVDPQDNKLTKHSFSLLAHRALDLQNNKLKTLTAYVFSGLTSVT